ncbi:L-Aspartase-like protein [Desarmillaria tabescens]|uniref:L-Aspartase-like protein n=1 Tax=Armillaria tabescens TaxID=1929756 RepID=A0AA39N8F2_ARMTA|nr:L-Aspartase-like protein [Desarmillaria tabescens]KAK0460937.1 L-Aspartase-like protein [Desarmillaria tabescens]
MAILSETRTAPRRMSSAPPPGLLDRKVVMLNTSPVNTIAEYPIAPSSLPTATLLSKFVQSFKDLESYKNGKSVTIDGQTLSIAAVTAASRYQASVQLTQSPEVKKRVEKSRNIIADKVDSGISVYGVSTGFGGSADTRTDLPLVLGHSLLQMQHSGVLPSSTQPLDALPLLDPMGSTTMPESWVRGAILIRMNSLIRGHSGVRWELIEKMKQLLDCNITPVVPLRGSISASGDLSPLSYIAGTLIGNPSIRVFDGPATFGSRKITPSIDALKAHNIEPLPLASKEPLGILNGTAFSASVASLALNDALHLTLLAQVCTAMGVEALAGTRASFDPFIHAVESAKIMWDLLEGSEFAATHEEEVTIKEDEGTLRQDRYPLRTAPQFIGPQVEDLLASLETITRECNSTTDNPLSDGETGTIHHGGNFQAMARLSLHHLGKILFAQCAELMDPSMNRGLPPSLAATDPSLDYHAKGIDIATACSAEMHNQAVNSLALISGRATINSLEVLSILMSSYIYVICQALDLRALRQELIDGISNIVKEELVDLFAPVLSHSDLTSVTSKVRKALIDALDHTTTMDAAERMKKVAASSTTVLVDFFTSCTFISDSSTAGSALTSIPLFRSRVASRATTLLDQLRRSYLSGERGAAPASRHLKKTRPLYEFVRITLGIRMHGSENYHRFINGHGIDEVTVGQNAIRDGKLQSLVVGMLS